MEVIRRVLGFRAMKKEVENFCRTTSVIKPGEEFGYMEHFILKSLRDFNLKVVAPDPKEEQGLLKNYFLARIANIKLPGSGWDSYLPETENIFLNLEASLEDDLKALKEQYKKDITHEEKKWNAVDGKYEEGKKLHEIKRDQANRKNKQDTLELYTITEAEFLYMKQNVKDYVVSDMVDLTFLMSKKRPNQYFNRTATFQLSYFDDWRKKDTYMRDWDDTGFLKFEHRVGYNNLLYYSLPHIIRKAEAAAEKDDFKRIKKILST